MTTVFDAHKTGPRTHTLVIGVGRYPHCTASSLAAATGIEAGLARYLTSLTSPPASARRFAEWLMTQQVDNPVAPLGSVELLMSAPPQGKAKVHAPGRTATVAAPTFTAVKQAFLRWYERCDTHQDNVAMFFFSGHGCAKDHQFLLLEDFGEQPLQFFANAINVDTLVAGMARCKADAQCYFVDACRTVPHELLRLSSIETNVLIQPHVHSPLRNSVVIRSAPRGSEARGVKGGTTLFTDALIEALDGGAAVRGEDDRWGIDMARIAVNVDRLLEWHGERQQPSPDYNGCRSKIIRQLVADPLVPFRFGCQPRDALASAALSLVDLDRQVRLVRDPKPALWEDSTIPSMCSLTAEFADRRYDTTFKHVPIMPPCVEEDLHVPDLGARRVDG